MGRESVIVSSPEIPGGAPCFPLKRGLAGFRSDDRKAGDRPEKLLRRLPSAIHEAAFARRSIHGRDRLESAGHAGLPNRQPAGI